MDTILGDIQKQKKKLISQAKRRGISENFGEREIRDLQDKHRYLDLCWGSLEQRDNARLIDQFKDWCHNYTGR